VGHQAGLVVVAGLALLRVRLKGQPDQLVNQAARRKALRLPQVEGQGAGHGIDLVDHDLPVFLPHQEVDARGAPPADGLERRHCRLLDLAG